MKHRAFKSIPMLFALLASLLAYAPQAHANRFYDPDTGRFLSPDPLGTVDGPNVYGFCGGDPVNRVDPMGTDSVSVHEDGSVWYQGANWLGFETGNPIHIGTNTPEGVKLDAQYRHMFPVELGFIQSAAEAHWTGAASDSAIRHALKIALHDQYSETYRAIRATGTAKMTGIALSITIDQAGAGFAPVMSTYKVVTGHNFITDHQDSRLQGVAELAVMGVMMKAGAMSGQAYADINTSVYTGPTSLSVAHLKTGSPMGFESTQEDQAAWGKLAVQERTAAFKSVLDDAGYRGTFAFGAYEDSVGSIKIGFASTEPSGYIPKVIRESSTSMGFPLVAENEIQIIGGTAKGFHADTKLMLTVRPYYMDATRNICWRQCQPLMTVQGVETSTPLQAPNFRDGHHKP